MNLDYNIENNFYEKNKNKKNNSKKFIIKI